MDFKFMFDENFGVKAANAMTDAFEKYTKLVEEAKGKEVEYTNREAIVNAMLTKLDENFDEAYSKVMYSVFMSLNAAKNVGDKFAGKIMLEDINGIFAKNGIDGVRLEVVDEAVKTDGRDNLN